MNYSKIGAILIAAIILNGCVGPKNRRLVCSGMLEGGIYRDAFQQLWGTPTRTGVLSGDEIVEAGWGGRGGSFYKGKTSYEMWSYEDRGVILFFTKNEKKLAGNTSKLMGWSTKKTVQELAAAAPDKCKQE